MMHTEIPSSKEYMVYLMVT